MKVGDDAREGAFISFAAGETFGGEACYRGPQRLKARIQADAYAMPEGIA